MTCITIFVLVIEIFIKICHILGLKCPYFNPPRSYMRTSLLRTWKSHEARGAMLIHLYDKIVQLGGSIFPLPLSRRWHLAGLGDPVQALQPSWIFWTLNSIQFPLKDRLPDSSRRYTGWREKCFYLFIAQIRIWSGLICHAVGMDGIIPSSSV